MKNYLKIYFWQIISIAFSFASVFVVTPYISSDKSLYGVYTVVMAAYLFISYADFGFLGAGMKYACECFAKKEQKEEIEIIGFSGAVFFAFVFLFSITMFVFAVNPNYIISNFDNLKEQNIASDLFFYMGVFCPVFVLQRIIQIIYGVRLKDYVFQKILIISNVIKISSAFYFFRDGNYQIVEYFVFTQICSLSASLFGLYTLKKKEKYDVVYLFNSFKFSKKLFIKTKRLAFSSIFLTISWIFFYEIDPFVIGKFIGVKEVALYAIGLTIMSYFRVVFGVLYTPFIAKMNYFIGLKDDEGLKVFVVKILKLFIPITVFPVIAVFFSLNIFVINWVGKEYETSVHIIQFLVLSHLFSFIISPIGILIMAQEKVKKLYFNSIIEPLIYWIGVITTISILGLQSFAIFKFVAIFFTAIYYISILLNYLGMKLFTFLQELILPAIIPVIIIIFTVLIFKSYFPLGQSIRNLLIYFSLIGVVVLFGTVIYYWTSKQFRDTINSILFKIKFRFN